MKTKQSGKSPMKNSKSPLKNAKSPMKNAKSPMKNAKSSMKNAISPIKKAKQIMRNDKEEEKMLTEDDVTDEMMDEMCEPDPDIDRRIENLKKDIEEVLKTQKQENSDDVDDDEDSDDTPEEATVKDEPKKVVVKRQKNKKQELKIKAVNQNNDDEDDEMNEQNNSGLFVRAPTPKKKQTANNKKNKQNTTQNKELNESGTFVKAPARQNNNKKNKQQNNQQNNNQNRENNKKTKQNNKQNAKDQSVVNTSNPQNKKQNGKSIFEDQNNRFGKNGQKRQLPKVRDDKEHKRRKPDDGDKLKLYVNGQEEELVRYKGFPIRKSEVERLEQLRKSMISIGISRSTVEYALKLERRKAVSKICYHCRKTGHVLSECPELNQGQQQSAGICFKCGSTEHSHLQCKASDGYKFATCFICREQGHLKKDCPKSRQEQQDNTVFVNTISGGNIDSLEGEEV